MVRRHSWSLTAPYQSYRLLQGFLTRDKGIDVESLDGLLKKKSVTDGQQDAFKRGFAEGFLKAQALTQRTQGRFEWKRNTRIVQQLFDDY